MNLVHFVLQSYRNGSRCNISMSHSSNSKKTHHSKRYWETPGYMSGPWEPEQTRNANCSKNPGRDAIDPAAHGREWQPLKMQQGSWKTHLRAPGQRQKTWTHKSSSHTENQDQSVKALSALTAAPNFPDQPHLRPPPHILFLWPMRVPFKLSYRSSVLA